MARISALDQVAGYAFCMVTLHGYLTASSACAQSEQNSDTPQHTDEQCPVRIQQNQSICIARLKQPQGSIISNQVVAEAAFSVAAEPEVPARQA